MKKTRLIITMAILLCLSFLFPIQGFAKKDPFLDAGFLKAKKKVPVFDFTLEDIDGKYIKMSDFKGKTVLLYFWTTW